MSGYTLVCKRRHLYLNPSGSHIYVGGPTGNCVLTAYGLRLEIERKAFEEIYNNDELYARHIRANENLRRPNSFAIYDELPEGWTIDMAEYGRRGLRGRWDTESKYVWAENMPPFRLTKSGYWEANEGYRQSLVLRKRS